MGIVPDIELSVLCEENCQSDTILFLQSLHRSFLIILMIVSDNNLCTKVLGTRTVIFH